MRYLAFLFVAGLIVLLVGLMGSVVLLFMASVYKSPDRDLITGAGLLFLAISMAVAPDP